MRLSQRTLRMAPIAAGVVLVPVMAVAVGTAEGLGLWIVAVLGGAVLGVLLALAGVGIAGASKAVKLEQEATYVDALTGLQSFDKLLFDLGRELAHDEGGPRAVLSLYLLDGLKKYNDAYGRACGDALLGWLAHKLLDAVGDRGTVYRLRGAEFAVVTHGDAELTGLVRADASTALSEGGEGFMVAPSVGQVILVEEVQTVSEALKLADHRAHAHNKATRHEGERTPPEYAIEAARPASSRFDVAELATNVGRRLGLPADLIDDVGAAAHLRDIGNMAVPAAVLGYPGSLPEEEWQFIRLHTVVGERLLAANFGMEEVASLVRSSHERWDGTGYPDGLRGEEIPLGSRIVFVCSAFEDMTCSRPHRPPLDVDAALAELQRGAGTQFDPGVVQAFAEAFPATRGKQQRTLAAGAHRHLRVLVADDDAASRFLLWRAVEASGHECVTAADGEQAWEMCRKQLPDVVISDARLPKLDGNELCRLVREDDQAPYTYFVMVTALGDLTRIRNGIGAGADDFLTKPIVRQELDMRLLAAARAVTVRAGKLASGSGD